MADYAVLFDNRPDTATYSSVIINCVPYDKFEDTESKGISKCARLLRGNFGTRIWASIRNTEGFKAAVQRMVECAENFEDEEE
jgi:hypothetical protein